jgi:hypothetical protein
MDASWSLGAMPSFEPNQRLGLRWIGDQLFFLGFKT